MLAGKVSNKVLVVCLQEAGKHFWEIAGLGGRLWPVVTDYARGRPIEFSQDRGRLICTIIS